MAMLQPLQRRARFYAKIISLLFARQDLAGGRLIQAHRGARHLSLAIKLKDPTELATVLKLSEVIALSANSENVLAQRQAGLVVFQFQLAAGFWQSYTRADLPTVRSVGLAERRQPVEFDFSQPHALVAGTTGSGKSETIKTILLSLMTDRSPDDLEIVLVDLEGDYTDFTNEAHLAAPVAGTQDEIEQALAYVNHTLAHRERNRIKDGKPLVLVIDEAERILGDDRRKLEIVRAASTAGRKYGIHVVIGTQKPTHKDLPGILDMLLNRFVGQVSDAGLSARLTGRSGLQAHLLTGSGDFVHVAGLEATRFQVAMATRADFDNLERKEISPPEIETSEVIELPAVLPERKLGRPKLKLNPSWLAWYFYHHPDKISRSVAREAMGLTRSAHDMHRDFCREFIAAYVELRNGTKAIGA